MMGGGTYGASVARPPVLAALMALGHSPSPGDHIDQCAQERHDDQEDDPHRLPPPAQILITEQIDDDLEQNHEIAAQNKGPNKSQKKSEKLFTATSVGFA